jgi:hypothetical protein
MELEFCPLTCWAIRQAVFRSNHKSQRYLLLSRGACCREAITAGGDKRAEPVNAALRLDISEVLAQITPPTIPCHLSVRGSTSGSDSGHLLG